MIRVCSVDGCDQSHDARGFCRHHYNQRHRRGEFKPLAKPSMEQRFWSHVDASAGVEECWPWTGSLTPQGYGDYRTNKKARHITAHRLAYELATGDTLGPLQADHMCHNRRCCNPRHLRPATNKQNNEHLRGAKRNSRSGVRGVYWHKASQHWVAQVKHNRKSYYLGVFDHIEDAAEAVLRRRLELFTHSDIAERAAQS